MNSDEAKRLYLNKMCEVSWESLEPNKKQSWVMPPTKGVFVVDIYLNCYGELMFRANTKLFAPFSVARLKVQDQVV
jgi:hypothetical protein